MAAAAVAVDPKHHAGSFEAQHEIVERLGSVVEAHGGTVVRGLGRVGDGEGSLRRAETVAASPV